MQKKQKIKALKKWAKNSVYNLKFAKLAPKITLLIRLVPGRRQWRICLHIVEVGLIRHFLNAIFSNASLPKNFVNKN